MASNTGRHSVFRFVSLVPAGLLCAGLAAAQVTSSGPVQTLDQVEVFDRSRVLDMDLQDRYPGADYRDFGIVGTALAACKLLGESRYCLEVDGAQRQVVRFWVDAQQPAQYTDLFRCDDGALGFGAAARPCTGLTVDMDHHVWVAGQRVTEDADYRLVKVSPRSGAACPAGTQPIGSATPVGSLCARQYATGRGTLTDLDAFDGEAAAGFEYQTGVLAVLDGKRVLYFNLDVPDVPPVDFGAWGALRNSGRLLGATILAVPQGPDAVDVTHYVLASTSTGEIRRKAVVAPGSTITAVPDSTSTAVFDIRAWESAHPGPTTVRLDATSAAPCNGKGSCTGLVGAPGVALAAPSGSTIALKTLAGATGIGVNDGASGPEIDTGQSLTVTLAAPQHVAAIEVLFLFNGPEFSDKAEVAKITADSVVYFLRVGNTLDDDGATWTGPGSVAKCGPATSAGAGCFRISHPFAGPVSSIRFETAPGTAPFPIGSVGTNESDFALGTVETAHHGLRASEKTGRVYLADKDFAAVLALAPNGTGSGFTALQPVQSNSNDLTLSSAPVRPAGVTVAPGILIDLADCEENCDLLTDEDGTPLLSLSSVEATGPTSGRLYEVRGVPDCRYVPRACTTILGLDAAGENDAREQLIAYRHRPTDTVGVIVPLDPSGPNRLNPAAQLLNVTPLLTADITALFDGTSTPPGGLPALYVSRWYRGQAVNGYVFNGFFFRADPGVVFTQTFEGDIDVLGLTGRSLGCFPPVAAGATIADHLRWDVITTVSETVRSVPGDTAPGGDYIDTLTNVGCRNPTRVAGSRISFFPYNLELAWDTYWPTVKRATPQVTARNDAVFARLTQSLYADLRTTLDLYTCRPGGTALNKAQCDRLRVLWSLGKLKLDLCVHASFQPWASANNVSCRLFRSVFDSYRAALPGSAAGADPDNRLGEQKWRSEVLGHVFETRFLPSIPSQGFCRERTAPAHTGCPPHTP